MTKFNNVVEAMATAIFNSMDHMDKLRLEESDKYAHAALDELRNHLPQLYELIEGTYVATPAEPKSLDKFNDCLARELGVRTSGGRLLRMYAAIIKAAKDKE